MGIPLAIEVTRHLGLDDYVILHKTPKTHLGDTLAEPVRSITTGPTRSSAWIRPGSRPCVPGGWRWSTM